MQENLNLKAQQRQADSLNSAIYFPFVAPYHRSTTVWASFGYAIAGITYVFQTQRNAKIHLAVTLGITCMGLWLGLSVTQWAILMVTIGLVLFAEMLNTVVEALVDLISPDFHPLAKIAKDAAAGAVFLLAIMSIVVGLCVLGPPLWQWGYPLIF